MSTNNLNANDNVNANEQAVMGQIANLKSSQKDIPLAKLRANPNNLRFRAGTMVEGIKVQDTYNIGVMKDVIRNYNGLPERMTVEEMADGTFMVLRGNRRYFAAEELYNDPQTPVGLKEKLEKLPCIIYKDLDDAQRAEIVNDQRDQQFLRSEIYMQCLRLQRAGWSFLTICNHMWPQLAKVLEGGQRKSVEISKAGSPAERDRILKTWLKGTLEMVILRSQRLGARTTRALLLTAMQQDGILPKIGEDASGNAIFEKPEFKPTQPRLKDLYDAATGDPEWTPELGGKAFNELCDKFKGEDAGTVLRDNNKGKTLADMKDQTSVMQSDGVKTVLKWGQNLLAANSTLLADVDAKIARWEQMEKVLVKERDAVKDETVKAMIQAFLTLNPLEMSVFLQKYC